jgi:streptomycin 6-kinase
VSRIVAAEDLERLARQVAGDWGLTLGRPMARSWHAFVAPVSSDAVLKVTSPVDDEANEEADALELWGGNGAAKLLRRERARRAMLIERARPGGDLAKLPEDEATAVAVDLGLRLWRPAAAPFRWIGDHVPRWLAQAERIGGPAAALIPSARTLYEAIDVGRSTLVHGDFHHHNVLDAGGRYIAIDPKAMLGEPEFDVAPFLWNPIEQEITLEVAERRLAAFAAAGLDEARMRAWSVIRVAYLGAYLGIDERDAELLGFLV